MDRDIKIMVDACTLLSWRYEIWVHQMTSTLIWISLTSRYMIIIRFLITLYTEIDNLSNV